MIEVTLDGTPQAIATTEAFHRALAHLETEPPAARRRDLARELKHQRRDCAQCASAWRKVVSTRRSESPCRAATSSRVSS